MLSNIIFQPTYLHIKLINNKFDFDKNKNGLL